MRLEKQKLEDSYTQKGEFKAEKYLVKIRKRIQALDWKAKIRLDEQCWALAIKQELMKP